jgi:hypothetical protein
MKLKLGNKEQFKWLKGIVCWIYILNVIDAVLTITWIYSRNATEANPLMAGLINKSPVLFVSVKLTLVVLGSWLLWRLRKNAFAVISIFSIFMVYYFLLIYHLKSMNLNLLSRLISYFSKF